MVTKRRLLFYVAPLALVATAIMFIGQRLLSPFVWVNEALHSTMVSAGVVAAIITALVLFYHEDGNGNRRFFWIAMGLLSLGILEGFHAVLPLGHGLVLTHVMAGVIGGFWFALVWFPAPNRHSSVRKWLIWITIAVCMLLGIWTALFRQTLPLMMVEGEFTTFAIFASSLAGVLFIAAAGRFLIDFQRSGSFEHYLWLCVALVFGLSRLTFQYSTIWDGTWWFWHGLELMGYSLVLVFSFSRYLQSASALRLSLTEHKQAEETLRKTRDYLDNLIRYANAPIIVWDREQRITIFNAAFEQLTGHTAAEVTGQPLSLLFPEGNREEALAEIRQTLSGEHWESVEIPILRKDDSIRIALWNSASIYDKDGTTLLATIAQGQDITERRQAEAEVKRRKDYLETIMGSSMDMIFTVKSDGTLGYANRRLKDILGYEFEDIKGRPFLEFIPTEMHPFMLKKWLEVQKGFGSVYETRVVRADGSIADCLVSHSKLEGYDEYLAILKDITERKQAEETLRKTKDYLDNLIRYANAPIIVWDREQRITIFNAAFERMTGHTAGEVMGQSLSILFPEASKEETLAKIRQTLSGEHWESVEIPILRKDDSIRIALWNSASIYDKDSTTLLATIAQGQDITERKQAWEHIQHLNSVLSALRSVNQLITHEFDKNRLIQETCDILVQHRGYILVWILLLDENGNFVSAAGSKSPEMMSLIQQMRQGNYPQCVNKVLTQGQPFMVFEDVATEHPQCAVSSLESAGPAYIAKLEFGGKIHGIIGVNISSQVEVTEEELGLLLELVKDVSYALTHIEMEQRRRMADEKLRRAAEEWRTTFDSIAEPVSIHDRDYKILRVNKAYAEVFKMKPEELIGKTCYEVVHGTKEPLPECPHRKTLETKKPVTVELFDPDKGTYWEVSTSPIFDEKGEVTASVHIVKDITERKKMEAQLMVTDRLASVGEMAAGIAHEINNPLTGVIGFSELLMERELPPSIKEDVEIIYKEAQRTARVVKNMLTFARRHEPYKQSVQVNEAINKTLELRTYEQKLSNISVITDLAPDLPEVMADYFQLQQVFLNLIVNAEYFMKEAHNGGKLTITTARTDGFVRISLTDDGPGISAETLRHLFNPFFTTKPVGKGTGLGLSICYGIITGHGGRIWAESEPGKGATFIIELPILTTEGEQP